MAIKLDMGKAYDSLEGDFIKKCFQDLGFSNQWLTGYGNACLQQM